jgi:hypothetical protein
VTVADARKAAREAQRRVALGEDPGVAKKTMANALSFNELADLFIERYANLSEPCRVSGSQDAFGKSFPHNGNQSPICEALVDVLLAHADHRGEDVDGDRLVAVEKRLVGVGLLERVDIFALKVLDDLNLTRGTVIDVTNLSGDRREGCS